MENIVYICCEHSELSLAKEISDLFLNYHIDSFISSTAKSNEDKLNYLQNMKVMVLLFSEKTAHSAIIDNEVTEAINNQCPIVPFQVDDTSVKENLSLDFMLKKSQWVLGYPNKSKQMDNLIVSVCRFLGVDAIEKNPTDPFEQLKRGIALEYGTNGLFKDRKEAMLWLEKSAAQNNALAMFELYKLHINTEDDNDFRDYKKAKKWLIKAADEGLSEAQYILGTNYEVYDEHVAILYSSLRNDISLPLEIRKDLTRARKYYIAAAKQGNKKAVFRLGYLCLYGTEEMRNKDYAFKFLSSAADIDNLDLWNELGRLYKEKKDYVNAVDCFQKAKFRGEYEYALCLLEAKCINEDNLRLNEIVFNSRNDTDPRFAELKGYMYEHGIGVELDKSKASSNYLNAYKYYSDTYCHYYDENKAIEVLEQASKYDNIEANYKLALYYLNNEDTENRAYLYFVNAALLGLPIAKFYVGYCFLQGIGIAKDYNNAFNWLKQSDIPGLSYSTYLLGRMYLEGLGTTKDLAKAFDCFNRAANQDEPLAEEEISHLYELGIFVRKNLEMAKEYHQKALSHGLKG